ncbi:MAG: aldehyde ferredoxin oxidoreductase family protein [Candidatus Helarchaeota archaeon]
MIKYKYGGFAGNILKIDLSKETFDIIPLDPDLVLKYLGGFGINQYLALNLIKQKINPYDENSPIILGIGTCVGTNTPGSSKIFVTTKSPLYRNIQTAAGSSFGYLLKNAGFDHLIISGKSKQKIYLKITNSQVEFLSADSLWGKGINETTDKLWDINGRNYSVIAIGPAGENQVNFAFTLVDKIGTLGKGGLGAIMGSKNLKAIIVYGDNGIIPKEPEQFNKITNKILKGIISYPQRARWTEQGTLYSWGSFPDIITMPVNNWRDLYPMGKAAKLYGVKKYKKVKKNPLACPSCPIGCKSTLEIKDGEYEGLITSTSSYATAALISVRLDLQDHRKGVYCAHLMDDYGLDGLATVGLVDFTADLYDKGIITDKDTDNEAIKCDFETFLKLSEKIVKREGFGDIIAKGWLGMIEHISKGADKLAIQIKGGEIIFDPRFVFGTEAFEQIVNQRSGAHVVPALSPTIVPNRSPEKLKNHLKRIGLKNEIITQLFTPEFNVAKYTRYIEDWYAVMSALGICFRHPIAMHYNIKIVANLYKSLTGINCDSDDLLLAGERINTLQKMLNVREGYSRKDDILPERIYTEPLGTKPSIPLMDYYKTKKLTKEDVDKLIDDYYIERGWETKNGIPTKEKLIELGLEECIEYLPKK